MDHTAAHASPPKAPNPSTDAVRPHVGAQHHTTLSDEPLTIRDEDWDIYSISGLAAVKMLAEAMQTMSDFMGDIPPTPPASRPTTPKKREAAITPPCHNPQSFPLSPVSPVSPTSNHGSSIAPVSMPSPEAHRDEPTAPDVQVDADLESITFQRNIISRRFFLKTVPPFNLTDYLLRIHKFCPHSPGVYLAAASYIQRLALAEMLVPATSKTVHRLALAAIRIASKVLEDNKWSQERIAKVGGISNKELYRLEISLCYLLDFNLFVSPDAVQKGMFLLQQAARQSRNVKRRLSDGFRMKLSFRPKMTELTAAQ
ncbi:hypothetical protein MBLNU457_6350t1 [Dothideomycetes sp. NU457]